MDLEAPVDAWYVFLATAIVSVALAGLALGVPSAPPPDAPEAANAIEAVTSAEFTASASYEHDADRVTLDNGTITMVNDHGTTHASFGYGTVVPVNGHERLENVTAGRSFEEEYARELSDPGADAMTVFSRDVERAFAANNGTAIAADDELRARKVTIDDGVDPRAPWTEAVEAEVTKTASLPGEPRENIREVTLRYDGVEERAVRFTVEGDYAIRGSFAESDVAVFDDGSGTIPIELSAGPLNRPALEPVTVRAEFLEDDELPDWSWTATKVDIGDLRTGSQEIEPEPAFDTDHPLIAHDDGGYHHVTFVTV